MGACACKNLGLKDDADIEQGEKNLIIVKAKPPKKSGKDIVHKTKELYNKIKSRKGE